MDHAPGPQRFEHRAEGRRWVRGVRDPSRIQYWASQKEGVKSVSGLPQGIPGMTSSVGGATKRSMT
jgi:hypothetical protein